mgnify:CR=1 FL=1
MSSAIPREERLSVALVVPTVDDARRLGERFGGGARFVLRGAGGADLAILNGAALQGLIQGAAVGGDQHTFGEVGRHGLVDIKDELFE